MPCPTGPCHLWEVRELTLPLTNCSASESEPCTSTEQHNRAESIDRVVGNCPENVSMGGVRGASLPARILICHMVKSQGTATCD